MTDEGFLQTPPALGSQFDDDRGLRGALLRLLPEEVHREVEEDLASGVDFLGEHDLDDGREMMSKKAEPAAALEAESLKV